MGVARALKEFVQCLVSRRPFRRNERPLPLAVFALTCRNRTPSIRSGRVPRRLLVGGRAVAFRGTCSRRRSGGSWHSSYLSRPRCLASLPSPKRFLTTFRLRTAPFAAAPSATGGRRGRSHCLVALLNHRKLHQHDEFSLARLSTSQDHFVGRMGEIGGTQVPEPPSPRSPKPGQVGGQRCRSQSETELPDLQSSSEGVLVGPAGLGTSDQRIMRSLPREHRESLGHARIRSSKHPTTPSRMERTRIFLNQLLSTPFCTSGCLCPLGLQFSDGLRAPHDC